VMWFVMLESAKDRVLGVDSPEQQMPPCVRYGMACLLIRDAVGSVPSSVEWEIGIVTHLGSHGARGVVVQPYTLFTLILSLHIIFSLHLLNTNHKSEGEDGLEFFDEEL
jgi:hypothetical protein